MTSQQEIQCSQCQAMVHPLDLFPKNICLSCHARNHENDSPDQILTQIMYLKELI